MDGPIAIVSHTLPPEVNGQAIVLGRLIAGADSVVQITSNRHYRPRDNDESIIVNVATPRTIRKLRKIRFLESWVFRVHVWHRARGISRALVQHGCSALIACTGGDLVDLPASIVAAEQVGVPCVLHYFDNYGSQWKTPNIAWSKKWMKRYGLDIESSVLAKAAGVVVPNELLQAELVQRVSVPVTIVRNPVVLEIYDNLRQSVVRERASEERPWSMTYTGSVYEAQLGAIINCGLALELLRARGISMQLHLYSSQSKDSLWAQGIPRSVCVHPMVSPHDASRLQCESDFLFLPLAFQTRYPELIRTSAPGKLGEYLASGRPIVVHAPRDSFLAQFTASQGCGLLCDTPDIATMAEKLERLIRDPALQAKLIHEAIATSVEFSHEKNRDRYIRFAKYQTFD